MNNTKREANTNNITINWQNFFDLYFKAEEKYEKLIRNLVKYASASRALVMFKEGCETRSMVENGIEYFKKRYKDSMYGCMKELRTLSTISKVVYGQSMVLEYIDTRNTEACYNLMDDLIEAFFYNIKVDLTDHKDLWKVLHSM